MATHRVNKLAPSSAAAKRRGAKETDKNSVTFTNTSPRSNEDLFFAQAEASFKKAVAAAIAENDRLGVPTHAAVEGKVVIHAPKDRAS